MASMLLLASTLMCTIQLGLAQTNCCKQKLVGNEYYNLVTSTLPVPSQCKNACVYVKGDDYSGKHYCFKGGSQDSRCITDGAVAPELGPPTASDGVLAPELVPSPLDSAGEWGIKIVARNSQDNKPVPGASADVSLQEDGQNISIASSVAFESDGTAFISISASGLYIVEIKAEGFIRDIEEILVNCTCGDCEKKNERFVALSPEFEVGETKIILTWDDKPVDMHVMTIKKSDNELCRTWFDGKNDCASISHDLDDVKGAETVTLLDYTVNTQYRYLIAVEDHDYENGGESFINKGTGIIITNGVQTKEIGMKVTTIDYPEEFYLFGCLDVQADGKFTFKAAPDGTFFDGHTDSEWKNMMDTHCQ